MVKNEECGGTRGSLELRNLFAFWIFGLSCNSISSLMIGAAQDIINGINEEESHGYSIKHPLPFTNITIADNSAKYCIEELGKPRCTKQMSTGAVVLVSILPAALLKYTLPFFMNRIPFGFRQMLVCAFQTVSYLVIAFSSSIQMSLLGVVFSAISIGLGQTSLPALSAHYSKSTIIAWSAGTGAAGLVGALVYAALTEPKLFDMSSRNALLSMLVVPSFFAFTYWFVLTPMPTVHRMKLLSPSTWIVPAQRVSSRNEKAEQKLKENNNNNKEKQKQQPSTTTTTTTFTNITLSRISSGEKWETGIGDDGSVTCDRQFTKKNVCHSQSEEPTFVPFTHDFSLASKMKLALPLLRYMLPMIVVFIAEYLVNSGLAQLMHFDCAHGFGLSIESQYRWYLALYMLGVFSSRSTIALLDIPAIVLYTLPFIQCMSASILYFHTLHQFIPHIGFVYALIFLEGAVGGISYASTFNRIHKEASDHSREFSISVASCSDTTGICIAAFGSIIMHNFICQQYLHLYP